jgi:carbon starvation protein
LYLIIKENCSHERDALIIIAIVFFALAYRFYFSFIAAKVAVINDERITPSKRLYDGQNFNPMSKWVLFGHHFAAIAGAVHDFVILVASINHDGKSIVEIAKAEIGKISGITTSIAVLIIIVIALAGLGLVVINSLSESSWGTFTIVATIPIAIIMGLWMFKIRKGKTVETTIFGVVVLSACVILGRYFPGS